MLDAYIRFLREDLEGTVAVNSYLSDVFKRFGVRFEDECSRVESLHFCEVTIIEGTDLLSAPTHTELEHFAQSGRSINRRLACEARIIKPGELTLMTNEKKEAPKNEAPKKDSFQQEFDALPLDRKIASLVRMEAVTLGETFAYVANSPWKVVEKVGDVLAEFGMKLENEARKAARPKEHSSEPKTPKSSGPPPKAHTSGKSSAPPKA